jgi:hypothetical protein
MIRVEKLPLPAADGRRQPETKEAANGCLLTSA